MKKIIVSGLITGILSGAAFALPMASSAAALKQFNGNLGYGTTNSSTVSELQQFLMQNGYLKISAPTGNFLSATKSAVETYQKAHGISATGYVGPLTTAAINGDIATANVPTATVAITSVSQPSGSLTAAAGSAINQSRTVTWATNGYPANEGVNINLIKKTSDSPAAYSLVRQVATNIANSGSASWQTQAGETGSDIYAEVTCPNASSAVACQISANPIQVE